MYHRLSIPWNGGRGAITYEEAHATDRFIYDDMSELWDQGCATEFFIFNLLVYWFSHFISKVQDIWGLQFLLSLLAAALGFAIMNNQDYVFSFLYVCEYLFLWWNFSFYCAIQVPEFCSKVPERSNSGFLSQFNRKWHSSLKYILRWCWLSNFSLEINMLTLNVIGAVGILWRTADGNWRGNKQVAESLAAVFASIFQCLALIRLYLHTTPAKIVLLSYLLVCASNHLLWR